MENGSKISVGSATEYESMIAEVKFGEVGGIILSKEPEDEEYMVSIHCFNPKSADNFDYNRNVSVDKIPLRQVMSALIEAKARLEQLG